MVHFDKAGAGRFCWLDLAATDADSAKTFYRNLFGWRSHEQLANGGSFTRLRLSNDDVGSIYQLKENSSRKRDDVALDTLCAGE